MLTSISLIKLNSNTPTLFQGYIAEAPQPGKEASIFIFLNEMAYLLETTPITRLFIVTGTNICYFETLSGSKYKMERKDDINGIFN